MWWRRTAVLAAVLVTACGTAPAPPAGPAPSRAAAAHLPAGTGAAPVVLLVPGGSWRTADPSGLEPLAALIAAHGAVTEARGYRAAEDGARFPVPVQDVLCEAARLVQTARAAGRGGGPLVLLGHSAGGQLVLLAALHPEQYGAGCDVPVVAPDGVVVLAGATDVHELADVARELFGAPPRAAADRWRQGDPFAQAAARPELPVLLVHGTADDVVPPAQSQRLADLLRAAGHDVQLVPLAGAGHADAYRADLVGGVVAGWVATKVTAAGTGHR